MNRLFLYAFLSIDCLSRKILSAPNLLRIEATENIFVECQDCFSNLRVDIFVKTFPAEDDILADTTVTLTELNKFQAFGAIKVW